MLALWSKSNLKCIIAAYSMLSDLKITLVVVLISCSILLLCFDGSNCVVTVSPSPRAAVCHAGDYLEVVCNTTASIVNWNVAFVGTNDRIERTVTSTQQVQEIVSMHSTVFLFSRTSELGTLPLISTLEISSVTNSLNGSTVTCMESSSVMMDPEMTTTVYIVGESGGHLPDIYPPQISIEDEHFGPDNVTAVLLWTDQLNNSLLSYFVSAVPLIEVTIATTSTSNRANVTVPYNSPHNNISVTADLCGRINETTIIDVYYANCRNPLEEPAALDAADSVVVALGYFTPALEGQSVDFMCPLGLILIGPNTSVCMRNGEWEPDPKEAGCQGKSDKLLSRDGKIAVASSVTVFTIASVVSFIIGFLCGHFCQKKRKPAVETVTPADSGQTQILYDDIVLKQELELKANVAYGPIIIVIRDQ